MKKINLFGFFVKHLGFLKYIPFVAFQFDSMLKLWMLLTKPQLLDCIDDIEAGVLQWPGTVKKLHKYGGLQFNYNRHELGHIHGNGILDLRFSREVKAQLLLDGRIDHHHVFKNSGWISFYIRRRDDHVYALKLLRMVYLKVAPKDDTL